MKSYNPPPGWSEVRSRLPGIVIFAPPPKVDEAPDAPVSTKCPNCGSSMAFDPVRQVVACQACGTEQEKVRAVGALAGAQGNEFTLEALRRGAKGWGTDRKTLHCGQCGSDLVVEPGALATSCPFCASNQVELVAGDKEAVRPGYVLPFKLTSAALEKSVKGWLSKGWMHPGELKDVARLDKFVGVYLPYWVFDARTRATYECEVGTDRQVTRRDSDGHTHTETVTDWEWKKGSINREWTGVKIPGTTKLSQVLLGRTHEGFDMGGCVPYDAGVLAGFQAQSYDLALPEAWEKGRASIRDLAHGACASDAKGTRGDHVRNMTMNASMDDEVWRYVMLPVYVSAYKFDNRTWQVMINGQTGDINGQKPVVWWRIYALIALMLSPGVCSGVVGIPLTLFGVGLVFLVLAIFLLIFAATGAWYLWQSATAAEAA